MKKAYIVQIILYGVFALLLVGVLLFALFFGGAAFNFNIGSSRSTGPFSYKLSNRQTISANGIKEISLDYSAESIVLEAASGTDIVLEEYLHDKSDSHKAIIQNSDSTLSIQQGQRNLINVGFMRGPRVIIYIPSDYSGELSLQTLSGSIRTKDDWALRTLTAISASGSVQFQNLDARTNVTLKSISGSVHAEDVHCGGILEMTSTSGSVRTEGDVLANSVTLESLSGSVKMQGKTVVTGRLIAQSNSGSVKLENVQVGIITAKSTSGSVKVEKFSGKGSFSSNSGSVQVNVQEITGNLSFGSTSGSVRLTLPKDAAFHFSASVTSGSIHTPFDDSLSFNRNGKVASGDIGQNPKHSVECTSTSGSVRVEWY